MHSPRPDHGEHDSLAPLARCPACGVRISPLGPGCPKHGLTAPQDAASMLATADHTGELPIFNGYRMARFLGRGGYGYVVCAERESDGKLVAIKTALKEAKDGAEKLQREAEVLRQIGKPSVPEVYECGRLASGFPYLVMELITAKTLAERLAEQAGPIPLGKAMRFARGILQATQNVHEKGFLHGDLKPENIFLHDNSKATLIDFGLVAPLFNPDSQTQVEDALPGTAEYMAPEQCEFSSALDARTDIYALGIIMYEMLCGRPPFIGTSEMVRQSQISHRPPRLATLAPIPPILEDIVHRCLQKRALDRYQTVAELRSALDKALHSDVVRTLLEEEISAPQSESMRPLHLAPPSTTHESNAAQPDRKRERAVLVFFESKADAPTIERALKAQGGEIASVAGKRWIALFGHQQEDNPARAALLCVRELIQKKLTQKAKVDIASVSVQKRPNGARRFVSPIFSQASRFPQEADPDGPTLSTAVTSVLHENDIRSLLDSPTPGIGLAPKDLEPETSAAGDDPSSSVGRDDVVAALVACAQKVAQGGSPIASRVIAAEGLGKTHLATELARKIKRLAPEMRVASIAARSFARGEGALANLLRAICEIPASMPPEHGKAWVNAALEGIGDVKSCAAVALALDFLPIDAPELRPLTSAPGALRSAMALGAGALLRQVARKTPLAILVDDAHLADEALLSALELATMAEAGAPIWALALGRPAFAEAKPNWGERAAHTESHTLHPLDPQSAAILCRKLLLPATDVPQAAIDRIVTRAQAVPFLLVELVRGLKQEGIVRKRPQGNSHFLATEEMDCLPDLPIVEWIADRELHSIAPNLASHARLLAMLEDDITLPEVESILRRLDDLGESADFPLDAGAAITRLCRLGILVKTPENAYRFRHPLVREAIAHSTSKALRRRIHQVALEHYQGGNAALPEEVLLSRLATHARGAGERVFAELAYLTLAERAVVRQRYLDAEIHYSRSLDLSTNPLPTTYRNRGRMRLRLGRYRDAALDFEEARKLLKKTYDPEIDAEILLDQAEALDWADDYAKAESLVEQAQKLLKRHSSPLLWARLLAGQGRSLHRKSLNVEAAKSFEHAIRIADTIGDDAYEAVIIPLLLLGFILQGLGQLERARQTLDRAVRLCEEHGDLLHLGPALSNVALLRALLSDKQGMVLGYQRVATIARELGQIFLELTTEFNLGEYLHYMNDLEQAEPHIRRAVAIEKRRSGARMLASVELLEARFELYRGNRQTARQIVERIRNRHAEAIRSGEGEAFLSPSDDVLCSMVELATATTTDTNDAAWDALEARSERYSVGQEQIEVRELRGLSALWAGHARQACIHLEKAIDLASRIPTCMHERLHARLVEAQSTSDVTARVETR